MLTIVMARSARTHRRTLMPKQRRAIKLQQWHIQPAGSEPPIPPTPPPLARWVLLLLPLAMPIDVDEVGLPLKSRLILPMLPFPFPFPLPFDLPLYVTMPAAVVTSSSKRSSIVRSVMAWPLPKCLLKLLKSWRTAFASASASRQESTSVWVPVTELPNCICGCLMSFSYLRFALLLCWLPPDIVILSSLRLGGTLYIYFISV